MSDQELIEKTDKAISELVRDRYDLQKAYNYYNGIRDARQFKYLEDNYGIGSPTSVEFTPLLRKHVDALVGEYLGMPTLPKVSCKDADTISKITREKQLHITDKVLAFLNKRLKSKVLESIQNKKDVSDPLIEKEVQELIEDLEYDFVSQYEIAAQNVIEYLMQSRATDFKNKLRMLLIDLLASGFMCYRTKPTVANNNIKIEILDPRNVFFDVNPESIYLKDCPRAVVRRWLNKNQILNEYGKDLTKEDREHIHETWSAWDHGVTYRNTEHPTTYGIEAGVEVTPGYPSNGDYYQNDLIPVYEVEWLETNHRNVTHRFKTVSIGRNNIYILYGRDDEGTVRTMDNPNYCTLSINGIYITNRGTNPYSLILACAHLQDKYDLLNFYRDNLLATSGTVGDIIDVSLLPKFLGRDLTERLQKALAWKKQGVFLIDSSQEGRMGQGQAPNQIYNGYDDTVSAGAMQAIQLAMENIEQTCSSITGVFRERLGGIQQRDAVTNVQASMNNSYIISKQWFQQMDIATEEILLDALNTAKRVFKNGLTGTLILGDSQVQVFTALPDYFTFTDYDIHITSSSEATRDAETLKSLIPELIKAGSVDPDIIIEAATTKSTSQIKTKIHKATRKKAAENNQIAQLTQQLEEAAKQVKQLEKDLEKANKQLAKFDEATLKLEKEKLAHKIEFDKFTAQTDRSYKEGRVDNDRKRTKLEEMQMYDSNPYNDKVTDAR